MAAMATGDLSWMGPEDDKGRRAAETGRNYVATRTVFFDTIAPPRRRPEYGRS